MVTSRIRIEAQLEQFRAREHRRSLEAFLELYSMDPRHPDSRAEELVLALAARGHVVTPREFAAMRRGGAPSRRRHLEASSLRALQSDFRDLVDWIWRKKDDQGARPVMWPIAARVTKVAWYRSAVYGYDKATQAELDALDVQQRRMASEEAARAKAKKVSTKAMKEARAVALARRAEIEAAIPVVREDLIRVTASPWPGPFWLGIARLLEQDRHSIARCPWCDTMFLKEDKRSRYCRPDCATSARAKKYYEIYRDTILERRHEKYVRKVRLEHPNAKPARRPRGRT